MRMCVESILSICLVVSLFQMTATSASVNITADMWQTFEFDTLSTSDLDANDGVTGIGTWDIAGATRLSTSLASEMTTAATINAAADTGTRGLSYDPAQGVGDARVQWTFDSVSRPAGMSFGFWFKADGAFSGSFDEHDIFVARRYLGNTNLYVKLDDDNGGIVHLFSENKGYSPGIRVDYDTWYWITGRWQMTNAVLSLHVYDVSGIQVGAEQQFSGSTINDKISHFAPGSWIGPTDRDTRGVLSFDDLIVDWTDATFPLGPGGDATAPPDETAPSVPSNVTTTGVTSTSVGLAWDPSSDDIGVAGYKIFRDGVQVATSAAASYTDTSLSPATTYSYTVSAYDSAGNNSAESSPPLIDTTLSDSPPTVSISSPSDGTFFGAASVAITAVAADDVAVAGVQFLVDGTNLGTEDTSSPFSSSWNTSGAADGPHTISALARDTAGNTTGADIQVIVDTQAPTGSVSINNGAVTTKWTSVVLNLSAADNLGSVTHMRFSNTGGSFSTPEAYAPTKNWTLSNGNGTRTVYVTFRDSAGNWSAAFSDAIQLKH